MNVIACLFILSSPLWAIEFTGSDDTTAGCIGSISKIPLFDCTMVLLGFSDLPSSLEVLHLVNN